MPDGDPVTTHSSRLLPVRQGAVPAMLKVATESEEKYAGLLMTWWGGEGAARVLAYDGEALLLERAERKTSLSDMARTGRDEEATRIICEVAARLHARKGEPLSHLIPLAEWFRDLEPPRHRSRAPRSRSRNPWRRSCRLCTPARNTARNLPVTLRP